MFNVILASLIGALVIGVVMLIQKINGDWL